MERVLGWVRHYALSVVLLLTAVAAGVAIYAVLQVQAERSATILRECLAQNDRHTATITELNTVVRQIEKVTPSRRAQLNASTKFTVLLIDQLAPYRDCQQVLAKSTSR